MPCRSSGDLYHGVYRHVFHIFHKTYSQVILDDAGGFYAMAFPDQGRYTTLLQVQVGYRRSAEGSRLWLQTLYLQTKWLNRPWVDYCWFEQYRGILCYCTVLLYCTVQGTIQIEVDDREPRLVSGDRQDVIVLYGSRIDAGYGRIDGEYCIVAILYYS